jgi:hypothetical protein
LRSFKKEVHLNVTKGEETMDANLFGRFLDFGRASGYTKVQL